MPEKWHCFKLVDVRNDETIVFLYNNRSIDVCHLVRIHSISRFWTLRNWWRHTLLTTKAKTETDLYMTPSFFTNQILCIEENDWLVIYRSTLLYLTVWNSSIYTCCILFLKHNGNKSSFYSRNDQCYNSKYKTE
jgi:hypothetical protein